MNYSDNSSFSSLRGSPKYSFKDKSSVSNMASEVTDLYTQIASLQSTNNEQKLEISDYQKRISELMLEKNFTPQDRATFVNQKDEISRLKEELNQSKQQVTQYQAFISAQSNLSNTSIDNNDSGRIKFPFRL